MRVRTCSLGPFGKVRTKDHLGLISCPVGEDEEDDGSSSAKKKRKGKRKKKKGAGFKVTDQ